MLPNCLSVHSNMAPAAQVRRQERGDRGEGVALVGWGGESVPHSLFPSFSLPFFSVMDARLWIMRQTCQCS